MEKYLYSYLRLGSRLRWSLVVAFFLSGWGRESRGGGIKRGDLILGGILGDAFLCFRTCVCVDLSCPGVSPAPSAAGSAHRGQGCRRGAEHGSAYGAKYLLTRGSRRPACRPARQGSEGMRMGVHRGRKMPIIS